MTQDSVTGKIYLLATTKASIHSHPFVLWVFVYVALPTVLLNVVNSFTSFFNMYHLSLAWFMPPDL